MLNSQDWALEICTLLAVCTPSDMFIQYYTVFLVSSQRLRTKLYHTESPHPQGNRVTAAVLRAKKKRNALYKERRLTDNIKTTAALQKLQEGRL